MMMNKGAVVGLVACALAFGGLPAAARDKTLEHASQRDASTAPDAWRNSFAPNKADLVSAGKNPFFVLEPGYRLHYVHGKAALTISVLDETEIVDGVETRVVEEREESGGKLTEVSRNYFAIDKSTGDVYYFGEDSAEYKSGKVVSREGSWRSGVDGARFGLMMPGVVKLGDKFYQEYAPKTAMDRAELVEVGGEVRTPADTFKDCIRMKETSPLEKGASEKWFARGVGMIRDDEFVLVKIERAAR